MKMKWLYAGIFLCAASTLFANMREVSFYCARSTKNAPVLDGKLDDPCWQNAMDYTSTYEYFKPNPGPGKLKNSIKMVYTEQGLYMGLTHFDDHTDKLRITVTERDNGNLWQDDCTEIYIDSDAAGIGWRKFVINAIGTLSDIWRIDGAVTRTDWTADGWEVKVRIGKKAWYIESFWPWETLGKKAKSGDIWTFCHVRYAWGSGSFIGTTSSPGGNYAATSNFGFLCFLKEGEKNDIKNIAAVLDKKMTPPWCLGLNQDVLFNIGNGLQQTTLDAMVDEQKSRITKIFSVLKTPAKYQKEDAALQKEYNNALRNIPKSIQLVRTLNELANKAEQFQWKVALENDFN